MPVAQLTIFGAGLIGGSIALRARERGLAQRIVAIDVRARAESADIPFDEWIESKETEAVESALSSSDLIVLCAPVGSIIKQLPHVLSASKKTVTDCGSTKVAIEECVATHEARGRFVPGHPMAGHPEGGFANARSDLFEGRRWILCEGRAEAASLNLVRGFVKALGAEVVLSGAAEHDRSVAITSHMLQVVASALSVYAEEQNAKRAAGPGFASATRVAGGAEAMWRDIFETNAEAVGSALVDLSERLGALGRDLAKSEVDGALEILERARKLRGGS